MQLPMMKLTYLTLARLPTEKAHGIQITKMCSALAAAGAQVRLVHPFRRQTTALEGADLFSFYSVPRTFSVETARNFDLFSFEHRLPKRLFQLLMTLHSLAWSAVTVCKRTEEPGEVYFTRDIPVGLILTILRRPFVLELHAIPRGIQRWMLKLVSFLPGKLIGIVTLTQFIKERLVKSGFDLASISVLPDGVDLNQYSSLPSTDEARQRYGLNQGSFIVGYIGRFQAVGHEKGISNLISAIALLKRENPNRPITLLCVGGPSSMIQKYQELAEQLGLTPQEVILWDRMPHSEIPAIIKACDVVTIPSPNIEFFAYFVSPLKLFEYLAAGSLIVSTDLPSIREILKDGVNAILTPDDSPEALAEGIRRGMQDPILREALCSAALNLSRKFDWKERATKILNIVSSWQQRADAHS